MTATRTRSPKTVPIAEHADVSQMFAPLEGARQVTFEEMQADGRMRGVRGRPPAHPLCRLVSKCPPTLAEARKLWSNRS